MTLNNVREHLKIHKNDNVIVALTDIARNSLIDTEDGTLLTLTDIPAKHKISVEDILPDGDIIMYGVLVGKARRLIQKGELISQSNIKHATQTVKLRNSKKEWTPPDVTSYQGKTFRGYHRTNGTVGTANHWLVIPLVFCENKNVDALEEAFLKELGYREEKSPLRDTVHHLIKHYEAGLTVDELFELTLETEQPPAIHKRLFPNVDGVKFLKHTLGCGGTRADAQDLCGLLAGYITHPNVAGATVLSLGCQNAQVQILEREIKLRDPDFDKPLYILEQQKIGNEQILLQQAVRQTFAGLVVANSVVRKPAPLNKLSIGLECGGSDGFSGISSNPAVGHVSDMIVALGGAVILSEFPELCGVEQELSDRCLDKAMAARFLQLMTSYQERAKAAGSGFESNPSPGNIKDGLVTDAIKSAGAAKKAGASPVAAVLDYPEKIRIKGLNLLCTPGSDVESTTAEVGAGATLVLFTTGLGTPTGNPIAPVLKISSNTPLYEKMGDIIDIDTGDIIAGRESIMQAGERILDYVLRVASGEVRAKADVLFHDDFIPWKRGISL
jgi:altronate hydrolase